MDDDSTRLAELPTLIRPTVQVRESWLAGERADCERYGTPTDVLDEALEDFDRYVAERQGVRVLWDVPTSTFWYISGDEFIGELVIRHELTPSLTESGGHIGYSVVTPWQRQGHATRMLAVGLTEARRLGLDRVLLTCDLDNEASRRVIVANGGVSDGQAAGQHRFWIDLSDSSRMAGSPAP